MDEEFDSTSLIADPANPAEVSLKTHRAIVRLMQDHGVEIRYGRLLPGRLRAHGLVAVSAEARTFVWQGGSPGTSLLRANFQQLRGDMIEAGYITERKFERDLIRLESADFLTVSPAMWTAWGSRPRRGPDSANTNPFACPELI